MVDEIYQHISYVPFHSFRAVAPDLADRTLIVNGVSKSYAMTGWRIGWGIGPTRLISAMVRGAKPDYPRARPRSRKRRRSPRWTAISSCWPSGATISASAAT